jgi:EmrB/QacA subfamily drug resistance transporter
MSEETAARELAPGRGAQGVPPQREGGAHWLAPVLVALIGAFMAILDTSIVNVAIPTIMTVFNAQTEAVQWVSTVYMLALGVVVPFSGWLGDRFGFKRLYILSMIVFVAGSLLCSASWSLNSLIFARVLQAAGGGMIMPTTMAMVFRMVPRDKFGMAMGVFGIALLVAPAIGPTLGGYLVEYVDWRWIFTINLPVGVIGVLLSLFVLPEFQSKHPGKLDIAGGAASAVGLFCLLLALSKGSDWGWGAEPTVLLLTISLFAFVLFVYIELTSENPLLDLRVFKYRSFAMANLIVAVTNIVMFSMLFFLPLFLQTFRGLGAMQTGLLMMPGALLSAVLMPVVGRLFDKVGPRPLAIAGILLLIFISYLFHSLSLGTATSTVMFWVLLRGMVMPLANTPAQTAAMVDIPTELVGRASAITNIISRVASSFGIAVLTSMLTTRQAVHSAQLSWTVTATNPTVTGMISRMSAAAGRGTRGRGVALAYIQGLAAQAGFVSAIDDVFLITAGLTVIALIPAFFLKKGARGLKPGGAPAAE